MGRRLIYLTALVAFSSACGCGEVPVPVRATFTIDAALNEPIETVTIYVLGNRRTDEVFLSCSSLMTGTIGPTDVRVLVFALGTVDIGGGTEQLDDIPAGGERIIYVAARGESGAVVGNGCAEHIDIRVDDTVDVDVIVFPLP